MKNIFDILKRTKPEQVRVPQPDFSDNWKQDVYERNVKAGVSALQSGQTIVIHNDDDRGYELALEIKRRFIAEYQKVLAEKIEIKNGSAITVSLKTTK